MRDQNNFSELWAIVLKLLHHTCIRMFCKELFFLTVLEQEQPEKDIKNQKTRLFWAQVILKIHKHVLKINKDLLSLFEVLRKAIFKLSYLFSLRLISEHETEKERNILSKHT